MSLLRGWYLVLNHSCFSFFVDAISFSLRQTAHMDQDSSSPLPKGRKPMQAPISVDESPPVDARIKRVQRSPAGLTLEPSRRSNRGMQLQAELGSDGDSSSAGDNSSDDDDESDLSYVSQGSQHSNAEAHVYALGQSSQGGFPTPLHLRRACKLCKQLKNGGGNNICRLDLGFRVLWVG
jgi:hypothetical protein